MTPQDWTKETHPKWCVASDAVAFISCNYWRVTVDVLYKWHGVVKWNGSRRVFLIAEIIEHFDKLEAELATEPPTHKHNFSRDGHLAQGHKIVAE